MALPSWQATIVRDNGDTIPGAEVAVVLESTGTAATIYSDRNGATALSPPYFADSDGYFIFYAADAEYRITATDSGTGFTRTWRYVSLISADGLGTTVTRDAIGAGDVYSRGGILGTVSQSGGVPTGAIIERGSNANGEYVKFADGTLFLTRDAVVDTTTDLRQTFNFPTSMLTSTKVSASLSVGNFTFSGTDQALRNAVMSAAIRIDGINGWDILFGDTNTEPSFPVRLFAMARWY